ncbi:MAG: hypothetical protein LAT57_08420 [Balneolales bacterium]|nr:hypothetical protein [Balneolales bacterium]
MSDKIEHYIMETGRVNRAIQRIAMQVVEDCRETGSVLLIGLNKRGIHFATALNKQLQQLLPKSPVLLNFDAKSDTISFTSNDQKQLASAQYILLVDDVLFSGTTMIRALQSVLQFSSPEKLRIAVLVDRGHRKYPIHADFVGIVSPTKFREHVEVRFDAENNPVSVNLLER